MAVCSTSLTISGVAKTRMASPRRCAGVMSSVTGTDWECLRPAASSIAPRSWGAAPSKSSGRGPGARAIIPDRGLRTLLLLSGPRRAPRSGLRRDAGPDRAGRDARLRRMLVRRASLHRLLAAPEPELDDRGRAPAHHAHALRQLRQRPALPPPAAPRRGGGHARQSRARAVRLRHRQGRPARRVRQARLELRRGARDDRGGHRDPSEALARGQRRARGALLEVPGAEPAPTRLSAPPPAAPHGREPARLGGAGGRARLAGRHALHADRRGGALRGRVPCRGRRAPRGTRGRTVSPAAPALPRDLRRRDAGCRPRRRRARAPGLLVPVVAGGAPLPREYSDARL